MDLYGYNYIKNFYILMRIVNGFRKNYFSYIVYFSVFCFKSIFHKFTF